VREPGGLELGDGLLNYGVTAVVGLQFEHAPARSVTMAVVVPGGEQCQLRPGRRADPAYHQPHLHCVRGPGERCVGHLGDLRAGDLRGGEPERDRVQSCSPIAAIAARIVKVRAMSEPASGRVVRQLRHDVDDVYDLVDTVQQAVTSMAATQTDHTGRFDWVDGRLDRMEGRLDGIEQTQRQMLDTQAQVLDLLRGRGPDPQ